MIKAAIEQYCRRRADGSYFRSDADAVSFARELEFVYTQTYDVEFPELQMASGDIVPIDETVPSGAHSYTYYSYEQTGVARLMNTYASSSIPRAGLGAKKHTAQIYSIPMSYGWDLQDIRASEMPGQKYNLRTDQAEAAKRATMQVMDTVGWFGDDEHGLFGLVNHPNVTHTLTPVGASSSQRSLLLKDPDEILADFRDLIHTPNNLSNGVETVTAVAVAAEVWSDLMSRPRSSTSDTTIGQFLIANHPDVTFMSVPRLNAAGHADSEEFAGKALMVAYTKSRGKGELVIPQQFEQMPPQENGLETLVYTHARVGGVKLPYPLSVHVYVDITGAP